LDRNSRFSCETLDDDADIQFDVKRLVRLWKSVAAEMQPSNGGLSHIESVRSWLNRDPALDNVFFQREVTPARERQKSMTLP
jgi:hypothetical protein